MKNTMVLLAAFVSLASCHAGWKTQQVPLTFLEKVSGVWMPKIEAEELRTKGNLESKCAQVLQDPEHPIINARYIDRGGNLFAYEPNAAGAPEYRLGVIRADGVVTYTGAAAEALKEYRSISVTIEGNTLTMTYARPDASDFKAVYLRSSEKETRANLEAQKACKK